MDISIGTSIVTLINMALICAGIYLFFLLIKALRRAIKALDIYMRNNSADNVETANDAKDTFLKGINKKIF